MASLKDRRTGLMSLPREIRDQTYGYVHDLSSDYRADVLAANTEMNTQQLPPRPSNSHCIRVYVTKIPQPAIPILCCSLTLRKEA